MKKDYFIQMVRKKFILKATPDKAIDTTGAGDAFNSLFTLKVIKSLEFILF